jgi:hypothetical protein
LRSPTNQHTPDPDFEGSVQLVEAAVEDGAYPPPYLLITMLKALFRHKDHNLVNRVLAIVHELGIPLDLSFFRQSILHTSNSKFNTIAETTLDDVRRECFELNGKIWNRNFLPFKEAREFVHSLNLQNMYEWHEYAASKDRHPNIPSSPKRQYENEWIDLPDWLGSGFESTYKISDRHLSYIEAKKFIKKFKFKSYPEYKKYIIDNNIDILPKAPKSKYTNTGDWKGYSDFFGTNVTANQNKIFLSYKQAKKFVHKLNLKKKDDWMTYLKSGKKPSNIASDKCVYKNDWISWGDFLGNGMGANRK